MAEPMKSNPTPRISAMRIASLGHAVFAAALMALGILTVIKGNFVACWQPAPKSVPAREVLVYLCAFICLASGIGVLWQRSAAAALRMLLASLLLWMLLVRVPGIFHAPANEGSWFPAGETAVILAGAWVLYAWFAADWESDWDRQRLAFATGDKGVRIARVCFGLALIPFGVGHFVYLKETAAMVPGWLPWHVAWTYFFGCTFIAAGVAVLIGAYARLAAALSALQMGMFTLLVWIPIVVALTKDTYQWSETIDSFALTAAAWVVADSYRGVPWLSVNKR
jgi:uncharacterized membrane protein